MFSNIMKFALVFTLCALALNMLIGYYVSFKRNVRETDPLYDVGFNLLPDISRHDWLSDVALRFPEYLWILKPLETITELVFWEVHLGDIH